MVAGWSALAGRRFDLVITAHSDPRYRMLAARVRAGERRWLGERKPRPRLVAGRYHGDEYVRLVTRSTTAGRGATRRRRSAPTLDAGVADRLAPLGARRLIALAPGGARNPARDNPLRRWPLEHYAALARRLAANGDAVLLTGSDDDAWTRAAFAGIDVVDLVGATTLPGLAALYARCAAVVTHDSGPLHVARLVDARVVALFGPTIPSSVDARNGACDRALAGGRAAVRALLRRAGLRGMRFEPMSADARAGRRRRGRRRAVRARRKVS